MRLENRSVTHRRSNVQVAEWMKVASKNVCASHHITQDDYRRLLLQQRGKCAICGLGNDPKPLVIDHDHTCCPGNSCGKCVRGLLCGQCNTALGLFADDADRLRKAARYVGVRSMKCHEPARFSDSGPLTSTSSQTVTLQTDGFV